MVPAGIQCCATAQLIGVRDTEGVQRGLRGEEGRPTEYQMRLTLSLHSQLRTPITSGPKNGEQPKTVSRHRGVTSSARARRPRRPLETSKGAGPTHRAAVPAPPRHTDPLLPGA